MINRNEVDICDVDWDLMVSEAPVVFINSPEEFDEVIDKLYWHSFSLFDQEGFEFYPGGSRDVCLEIRKENHQINLEIVGHCIAHGDFNGEAKVFKYDLAKFDQLALSRERLAFSGSLLGTQ